ncbi:hypothetical protein C8Q76DRAFT_622321 [Earliella scabrosa]|nr:hypothetical protein C8Q76DRAFT_622321 [Earliella scabrosa]
MPIELVHEILREAWSTFPLGDRDNEWGARWDFYHNISLVSRPWAGVMATVALQRITIQCAKDFAFYRRLIIREFGADLARCEDTSDSDIERVDPSARAFFERSTIHIVLTDIDWSSTNRTGIIWRTNYALIPHYVPACRFIEVIIKELPSDDRFSVPYRPLFEFLAQYQTTRDIRLAWTYTHIKRYILPTIRVEGVTYLRLHLYPRCVCHNLRTLPANGPGVAPLIIFPVPTPAHQPDCFSYRLPTLFPDLRHLHIDTPYILKSLKTLPALELLTIEAPPMHYLPELGQFSSVMEWNIVSAVSAGLMRSSEGEPRKKIAVNAGPTEPVGWKQAVAACDKHGVELEHCRVYELPPLKVAGCEPAHLADVDP